MEIDLKRKEIMLIIIIVLALVFGLGYRLAGSGLTNPYETVITETDGENADTAADKGANDTGVTGRKGENLQEDRVAQMVYFHIVGAVNKPGLYWLPEGARVADAVRLAIPSSRADLNALNLAELVVDQQKFMCRDRERLTVLLPRNRRLLPPVPVVDPQVLRGRSILIPLPPKNWTVCPA